MPALGLSKRRLTLKPERYNYGIGCMLTFRKLCRERANIERSKHTLKQSPFFESNWLAL
jgi:hypothetical protein